jgi:acetoin utilization deacetylase AcuC-like enzyme
MRGWPVLHAATPCAPGHAPGFPAGRRLLLDHPKLLLPSTRRRAAASFRMARLDPGQEGPATPRGPVLYYSDVYHVAMPPAHRFPMHKYAAVRAVLERHPRAAGAVFRRAPLAHAADLLLAHGARYVARVLAGELSDAEARAVGLPCTPDGVVRARGSTGGTIAATCDVLRFPNLRICGHIAGGTHHAFFDRGGGFCVFNDIAVAARVAMRDFPDIVRKVLVIDLDTHQGDGTASIFADDASVVTFSMHGENNYPSEKMESDYDVGLPDGTGDEEYLAMLVSYIPRLLDEHTPDLVFYQAGVDSLEQDALGRLSMSRRGVSVRNKLIYRACIERRIPCVVTMGGGYSRPDIGPSVDAVRFFILLYSWELLSGCFG